MENRSSIMASIAERVRPRLPNVNDGDNDNASDGERVRLAIGEYRKLVSTTEIDALAVVRWLHQISSHPSLNCSWPFGNAAKRLDAHVGNS